MGAPIPKLLKKSIGGDGDYAVMFVHVRKLVTPRLLNLNRRSRRAPIAESLIDAVFDLLPDLIIFKDYVD